MVTRKNAKADRAASLEEENRRRVASLTARGYSKSDAHLIVSQNDDELYDEMIETGKEAMGESATPGLFPEPKRRR